MLHSPRGDVMVPSWPRRGYYRNPNAMGFSIAWVAVRGRFHSAVLAELGLRGTGQYEEFPESPLACACLPTGWFLVFDNRCELPDPLPLARLSAGAEVVTCFVEEH